jgi:predicted RNase H-like HicB family nuclease
MEEFTILIEQDEDGLYVASVPEIQGCHTQGKTIPEVLERIKEAIEVCLEADEGEIKPMRFIGIQKISVKEVMSGLSIQMEEGPLFQCMRMKI